MQKIEQTLDSREVAEMVDKEHSKLLRDIYRYEEQFAEAKIGFGDFFKESSYLDANKQKRPCRRITKKGCEFIAHKLTGVKGTIFTARYINRFHEMEEMLFEQKQKQGPELPWFIRHFQEMKDRKIYIILDRDFIDITGYDFRKEKGFYWGKYFKGGRDYNGWDWHTVTDKEKFKEEHGFEYGEDECMHYFYLCGAVKALDVFRGKIPSERCQIIRNAVLTVEKHRPLPEKRQGPFIAGEKKLNSVPIQINISLGEFIAKSQN